MKDQGQGDGSDSKAACFQARDLSLIPKTHTVERDLTSESHSLPSTCEPWHLLSPPSIDAIESFSKVMKAGGSPISPARQSMWTLCPDPLPATGVYSTGEGLLLYCADEIRKYSTGSKVITLPGNEQFAALLKSCGYR